MKSSILAAILAGIFSLFGFHQPLSYHAPVSPRGALAASATLAISYPINSQQPPSATPPRATPDRTTLSPLVRSVASTAVSNSATTLSQLTILERQFASAVQALATVITSLGKVSTPTAPNIQPQLDALQREISLSNSINSLPPNVTITSPTFSGVTTDNIPEGSNLYYTDARVEAVVCTENLIRIDYLTESPNVRGQCSH